MFSDTHTAFAKAKNLHTQGRLLEAEQVYRSLAKAGTYRNVALEALADMYLQEQRLDEVYDTLRTLTEEDPDSLHYCARLASYLDSVGQTEAAIDEYLRLLQRQPELPVAHYNLAQMYTRMKQYADALSAYKRSIFLKIDRVEEVYSNMGVLLSEMQDANGAREMYQRALDIAPDYIPALYNLAGHFEEANEKQQAIEYYERILSINPRHWDALARLAYPRKITSEHQELIVRLESAVEEAKEDNLAREGLYFALGKAFDDLKLYDKASAAYVAANELGKRRAAPYDRGKTEQAFDQLIDLFDSDWVNQAATQSTAAPIFICGMLRSGSTLLEQMLAAHPAVTAGGEIVFLPWLIGRELAPYPQGARNASGEQLCRVRDEYLSRVRELFPHYENITDKRPDNFLHLGIIKALFPAARIIHTRRNMLDNSLSLYFQQLGRALSYATDLESAAHYYQQQDRLMAHWSSRFGTDIFAVDYEELVESPEPIMRRLIDFLGLEWDARVLEFQQTSSLVKTASLWQVREELHSRSSGRWRNYEALVRGLQANHPSRDSGM